MIYLYFVRHGETLFNIYHRMQGWCDTPLTAKGRQQALDVAYGLDDIPFTHVYSSDSGRAMETARTIAAMKKLKPIMHSGFREMFFGTMEGLDTYTGRFKDKEYRDREGWIDVGGENMEMLQERMFQAIYSILPNDNAVDEHIVIVSHGIAIMSLVQRLDEQFFQKLEDYGGVLKNTSVTTITYAKGSFKLQDFNNITYVETGGILRNEENY